MRWHRRTRPAGRGLLAALLVPAGAAGLVLAPATLTGASATFSASTVNTGDTLATGQLQPPTGLSATQTCTSTPTITHRPYSAAVGTGSVSLAVPSGTTTGDVMLAQIVYPDGAEVITAPSGWTLLTSGSSGTQLTSAVYWKAATAGEPTVVFGRPSGSTGDFTAVLVSYTGARLSAPTVYGSATGTGTTAATPSVTTTGTTTEVMHFLTQRQGLFPVPAGTTQVYSGSSGNGPSSEGLTATDETFAGPGATTSRSATSSTSAAWVAHAVVLRRVAGTPSANLGWTASPSSWASGYELTRVVSGTTQATQTVAGVATTSTTDGPLSDATTYTYQLTTSKGSWRSTAATTTLVTNC